MTKNSLEVAACFQSAGTGRKAPLRLNRLSLTAHEMGEYRKPSPAKGEGRIQGMLVVWYLLELYLIEITQVFQAVHLYLGLRDGVENIPDVKGPLH